MTKAQCARATKGQRWRDRRGLGVERGSKNKNHWENIPPFRRKEEHGFSAILGISEKHSRNTPHHETKTDTTTTKMQSK